MIKSMTDSEIVNDLVGDALSQLHPDEILNYSQIVVQKNEENRKLVEWISKLQIGYNATQGNCMIIVGNDTRKILATIQYISNHLNTLKRKFDDNTLIPPDIQLVWFKEEHPSHSFVWTQEKINMIHYLNRYIGLGMIFGVHASDLIIPDELKNIANVIHVI